VINEETRGSVGSVDVLDLLSYVLSVPMDSPSWALEVAMRFKTPIYRCIDFSKKNPFAPVLEIIPLSDVILSQLSIVSHRVPVLSPTNSIVGILSQSDVIEFMKKLMDNSPNTAITGLSARSIASLHHTRKVISVPSSGTLLTAFEMLSTNRVNGVAVVDEHGALVGNVSASDFKGVTSANFLNMGVILKRYLTLPPVSVKEEDTYYDITKAFVDTGVQRIYVVNNRNQPVGVVTLTDMMNIIVQELNLITPSATVGL